MPTLVAALAVAAVAILILTLRWRAERQRATRLEREVGRLRARLEAPGPPTAHELEQEVDRLRENLDQAAEAREAFFDLVTHELRSPLAAILGYQELLTDGAYGELDTADEPIERIGRSARHLLHLIDGVVELSRIRAASVQPDLETVNLGVVLTTATEAFRTAARERGLEALVEIPERVPTIRSDQERLVRALDLLITSGVKYPAASSIHLDVHREDDDGVTLRIHPTELETRQEADDPALRLGLRLAVAQGLAAVLGGHLDLEIDDHGVIRAMAFRIRHHPGP